MAVLTFTRLENHPDGTIGIAGIINGNWERLESLFNPALTSADLSFQVFHKALTRNATLPTTNGSVLEWDQSATKVISRPGYSATSGTAPVIDLKGAKLFDVTLTGDATFTTSNRAAGFVGSVVIRAGASLRNLTFPAWKWIGGTAPASIAATKTGLLELQATGTTDAEILARWTVES